MPSEAFETYLDRLRELNQAAIEFEIALNRTEGIDTSLRALSKTLKSAKFALERSEQHLQVRASPEEKATHYKDVQNRGSFLRLTWKRTTDLLDEYHRRRVQADSPSDVEADKDHNLVPG